MKKTGIEDIRREIRHKDRDIVRLLNERARLSLEVGKIKGWEGIGVYDPAQESRVLAEIAALNEGPIAVEALGHIYREILSSSRALQAPLAVACLGPEGSFAHLAALDRFGQSARMAPQETIGAVFDTVEKKKADLITQRNNVTGRFEASAAKLADEFNVSIKKITAYLPQ